jgi:cell division protein FtsQ
MKREIARPNRWKLLWRRQRRNLRMAAFALAGFMIVLVCVSLTHSAERGGTVAKLAASFSHAIDMRVKTIEIDGRANTPEKLLRAALGVSVGDPILGFSVEAARARIEQLSWVQHVAVERRLPNTIHVELVERRPFAIWQYQGKFQLIDRAGEVVTNEDVAAFTSLPLVVGQGAPSHAADMLAALDAVPDIHARVAALVRVGERRWNLQLKNNVTVMLPEGHETAALARLEELQIKQQMLDRPLVFIDMRLADRLATRARNPGATTAPDNKSPDAAPVNLPQATPHETPNRRAT